MPRAFRMDRFTWEEGDITIESAPRSTVSPKARKRELKSVRNTGFTGSRVMADGRTYYFQDGHRVPVPAHLRRRGRPAATPAPATPPRPAAAHPDDYTSSTSATSQAERARLKAKHAHLTAKEDQRLAAKGAKADLMGARRVKAQQALAQAQAAEQAARDRVAAKQTTIAQRRQARAAALATPATPAAPAAAGAPASTAAASKSSPWKEGSPSIQVDFGTSGVQTKKNIRRIFGRDLTNAEIQGISCAPPGARVALRPHDNGGFSAQVSHEGVTTTRRFKQSGNSGRIFCDNSYFRISPNSPHKSKGAEIFNHQVQTLTALKVDRIETHAAGGGYGRPRGVPRPDAAEMNGYYTWPRLGYEAKVVIPKSAATSLNIAGTPENLGGENNRRVSTHDIMATKAGQDWWYANGHDHFATFDLKPGSKSHQILAAYMEEKKKKKSS